MLQRSRTQSDAKFVPGPCDIVIVLSLWGWYCSILLDTVVAGSVHDAFARGWRKLPTKLNTELLFYYLYAVVDLLVEKRLYAYK